METLNGAQGLYLEKNMYGRGSYLYSFLESLE